MIQTYVVLFKDRLPQGFLRYEDALETCNTEEGIEISSVSFPIIREYEELLLLELVRINKMRQEEENI